MDSLFILIGLVSLGVYVWFLWAFAGLCDNVKKILKELKKEDNVDTAQEENKSLEQAKSPPDTAPSIWNTILIISIVIVGLIIIVTVFN